MGYWKSEKNPGLVRDSQSHLNLLFRLANADLESLRDSESIDFIRDFARFLAKERSDSHNGQIPEEFSVGDFRERKDLFLRLQSHLISRVNTIMDASMSLWDVPLWEITGSLSIGFVAFKDRFSQRFIFQYTEYKHLLEKGKHIVDLRIAELIRDLDLRPTRFRRCQKCKALYYQPTAREKNYCSSKCSGAARQERFREKRRLKKEVTQGDKREKAKARVG